MINKTITNIKSTRQHLLGLIEGLTTEQLNKVPEGFNNNIVWNLAHMISAQQGICYLRAGTEIAVDDKYFSPYRPGTKPEGFVDSTEIENIKTLLLSSADKMETDYNNGIFANYTPWIARYGVNINNAEDAINFLPFHDGLHTGYIMAIKKFV
ncbi:DinB family protein [Mucilaginibacter segetis]|uniref:DinB family protein n=1 Tax=Mucilaginibacter segetis TaxID=2793071 RepID=A0A934PTF9_9SPHI|nr:DinB family protein [Mucilaginibacter segetis]MBK0380509.1 DinB family protein [Mucilaginibacter segetis]